MVLKVFSPEKTAGKEEEGKGGAGN